MLSEVPRGPTNIALAGFSRFGLPERWSQFLLETSVPIGPQVVPFWDYYFRNYLGAYG